MAQEEFVNCHFQTDLWTVRLREEIPSWSAENDFRWPPGVAPSNYGHTSDASPSAGPGSPSRSMNPSASSHPEDADRRKTDMFHEVYLHPFLSKLFKSLTPGALNWISWTLSWTNRASFTIPICWVRTPVLCGDEISYFFRPWAAASIYNGERFKKLTMVKSEFFFLIVVHWIILDQLRKGC